MHVVVVGLNYKTAPVEIRERFAFREQDMPVALEQLRNTKSILECVIVSTCNRTEIYAVVDQLHTYKHFIRQFMEQWFSVAKTDFDGHLYIKEDDKAVEHLFRVTSGLDSMVVGETQILGQVRDAFFNAQQAGATGTIFNTLFKQAITMAKRAHSETTIGENAVSVSYAAIELGKKIFGVFDNKTVLILGAGKMSELTIKHLMAQGTKRVIVVNRTYARAQELAAKIAAEARPVEQLQQALAESDILISSTGAQELVLKRSDVAQAMKKRPSRPIFMIDIAVPRDLDPEINELPNVFLYDIDDLQGIVQYNLQERQKEARLIEAMIEEEIVSFNQWLKTLGVVPVIKALREKALAIQEETMASIQNKIPDLTERELKVLRKHTKSIVNQLLRDPILKVKEMANEPDGEKSLELFAQIFALEEALSDRAGESRLEGADQPAKEETSRRFLALGAVDI